MREMREALVAESAVLDKGCPRWHLSGMKINVTICGDCPFALSRYYDGCEHPLAKTAPNGARVSFKATPPDWCPLRTEDVLVTLRVKETP